MLFDILGIIALGLSIAAVIVVICSEKNDRGE